MKESHVDYEIVPIPKKLSRSLIVLKPDMRERELDQLIYHKLKEHGIRPVESHLLNLDLHFIRDVWRGNWTYYDENFYRHVEHMVSDACELWILEGEEGLVDKVLEIKSSIRDTFADSRIENLLHSPDTQDEADLEVAMFEEFIEQQASLR